MEKTNTKPTSWLWGARTYVMPKWISQNPKAFRLLYEFAERSHRIEEDIEYEGVLIHLKPREFITGRPSTSEKVGISEQEYRTLYKRFEKLQLIRTVRTTNRLTIGLYLADAIFFNNPSSEQPPEQPTYNQQPTTINNENKNEEKNFNNTKPSAVKDKSFERQEKINTGFNALSESLKHIKIPSKPSSTEKWQEHALRLASRLGHTKASLSWFKLFKLAYKKRQEGYLDNAAYYCVDAPHVEDIEKLFYWKFHQLVNKERGKSHG